MARASCVDQPALYFWTAALLLGTLTTISRSKYVLINSYSIFYRFYFALCLFCPPSLSLLTLSLPHYLSPSLSPSARCSGLWRVLREREHGGDDNVPPRQWHKLAGDLPRHVLPRKCCLRALAVAACSKVATCVGLPLIECRAKWRAAPLVSFYFFFFFFLFVSGTYQDETAAV